MVEDMAILLAVLRERRRWIAIDLDIEFHTLAKRTALRIELARINAEIARRCWNRMRDQAALRHSPIGPLP